MRRPDWSRDPAAPSLLLFGAMVLGGFVAIGLGWRAAARTLFVPFQVPALLSGGVGGLALIVLGAGLASTQVGRRLAAQERAETEDLLDEAAALMDVMKGRRP
ncbi:MAG TPA: hypothetical protein VMZ11_05925 [Mycobacteriales bacterium]|nr:hypothetical protein [Mycobacteriales bacterium]